jgi:hypothetical protein
VFDFVRLVRSDEPKKREQLAPKDTLVARKSAPGVLGDEFCPGLAIRLLRD